MGIPGPRDYNGDVTVIGYIDRARPAVVYGWLAVLLAAVFVPMSLFGLVDGDEGTYLLVSRLRSEEHTSELQSLRHLVCRLLLEKKKKNKKKNFHYHKNQILSNSSVQKLLCDNYTL